MKNEFIQLDDKNYTKTGELNDELSIKVMPDSKELCEVLAHLNYRGEVLNLVQDIKSSKDTYSNSKKKKIIKTIQYLLWRYDLCPKDIN